MSEIIMGILVIGLPVLFVVFLAWAEFDYNFGKVILYFFVMGAPIVIQLIWNPFSNLKDWQLGLFGLLFGLAIIGIHYMIEHSKK